jgi:serine/threonine protein kinase
MAVVQASSSSSSWCPPPKKRPKRDAKWLAMIKRRKAYKKKKTFFPDLTSSSSAAETDSSPTLETSNGVSWTRLALLGKGAFGSVFYAKTNSTSLHQETHLPLQMAVKSAVMENATSLKYEKHILCDLAASPHVVRCYGDEITHMAEGVEIYNLLLEFCSGFSLESHIRSSCCGLLESDVRDYARDILQGLKYIHSRGYIHCDIKPCNILLATGVGERFGRLVAKLADFGLAKAVNQQKDPWLRGTYRYMSPELVKDKTIDYPVDIWAFGCAVVEMLTGKPAWNYSEVEDLLYVIGKSDQLPNIPCDASEDAKDFLSHCFARSAALRWSAEMLLEHPFISMTT